MTRCAILLVAAFVAVAAPARVWCEARCLAPAHHASDAAKPHCQVDAPSPDVTSMSASVAADCTVFETARAASAKIALARTTALAPWQPGLHQVSTSPVQPARTALPRRPIKLPLRI